MMKLWLSQNRVLRQKERQWDTERDRQTQADLQRERDKKDTLPDFKGELPDLAEVVRPGLTS